MTEHSGRMRLFNMTGADMQEIEEQYTAKVMNLVQYLLLRHDMMAEYFKTRSDWKNTSKLSTDECWSLSLDVDANVLPPTDTESWFHSTDEFIILDDGGWEVILLDEGARKALAGKDTISEKAKGICIPATEVAARGAALRAIKLVDMYNQRIIEDKLGGEIHGQSLRDQGWDGVENLGIFMRKKQMEYMKDEI